MKDRRYNDDFFNTFRSIQQIPSGFYDDLSPKLKFDPQECPLCQKKFTFFHGGKTCTTCRIPYCADCVRKTDDGDKCVCCIAVRTNPTSYDNIKQLEEYRIKYYQSAQGKITPLGIGLLIFLRFLQAKSSGLSERAIIALFKLRKYYIKNQQMAVGVHQNLIQKWQALAKNWPPSEKEAKKIINLPLLIDLICDFSIYNKDILKSLDFKYEHLKPFLNPKDSRVSAAASRFILILTSLHIFKPDQPPSIKLLSAGCKEAIVYTLASLVTVFPIPSLYEDTTPSQPPFSYEFVPQIISDCLALFTQGNSKSTIATQYYAAIILLKLSESNLGLTELIKYLPLKSIITNIIVLCPRKLGVQKREGRIAVYLARLIKNVLFFCEKSPERTELLDKFSGTIFDFIFDVTEHRPGFDRYSYLCVVQEIALDLADDLSSQEPFSGIFMNPQLQEKFKEMKDERRTAKEIEKQKKIDFLNDQNQQMEQLTQEQILTIQERENENKRIRREYQDAKKELGEKEKEIENLKKELEATKAASKTKVAALKKKNAALEAQITALKKQDQTRLTEIENLNQIISAKETTIEQLNIQKVNIEENSENVLNEDQIESLLNSQNVELEANKKMLAQKTKEDREKAKQIQQLTANIADLEKEKKEHLAVYKKKLNDLQAKLANNEKQVTARDEEIDRLRKTIEQKNEEIDQKESMISSLKEMNESNIIQVNSSYQTEIKSLQEEIEERDEMLDEASNLSQEQVERLNELKQQYESATNDRDEIQNQLNTLKEEMKNTQDELESIKSENEEELAEKESLIEEKQKTITEKEAQISDKEKELQEKNSQLNELKQSIREIEGAARKEIDEKKTEIDAILARAEEHKNEVYLQSVTIDNFKEKVEELQTVIGEEQEAINDLKTKHEDALQQIEKQNKSISKYKSKRSKHEKELKAVKSELEAKNEMITQIKAEAEQNETIKAEKDGEIKALKKSVKKQEKSIKKLNTQMQEEKEALQTELNTAKGEIDGYKKQIETKTEEIESLKNQIETKASEITLLKGQLDSNNGESSDLIGQIEAKNKEILELKEEITQKTNEISHLKEEMEGKDEKIEDLTDKIDNMGEKFDSLHEKFNQKDQEIEDLKKKNAEQQEQIQAISEKYATVLENWKKTAEKVSKDDAELDLQQMVDIPE